MPTPSRQDQIAEGKAREQAGAPATQAEIAAAMDVPADTVQGDLPAPRAGEPAADPQPQDRQTPQPRVDSRRADIAARFRTERNEETRDAADDIAEFARTGMPEEFRALAPASAPEEAPLEPAAEALEAAPEPEAEPAQPQKRKLKVRGQEIELTDDELIAHAQKSLAGDSYLQEARSKLDEVDALLRDTRNKAQRPGQPATHPDGQDRTQFAEPAAEPPQPADPPQPEEDPLQKAIEAVQFGDPAEARDLLRNTIQQEAAKVVNTVLHSNKADDETTRTRRELQEFEAQHTELANDPMARAAIEAKVYNLQIDDMKALGFDPSQIRTPNNRPVTPADIADAHRWCRMKGLAVSTPKQLLEKATDAFLEWRGQPKPAADPPVDPNPQPAPQPRVQVQVDRSERRAAIPQQPSRSAAPRLAPAQAPQPRDRTTIVQDMKQQRARPRGQVVA